MGYFDEFTELQAAGLRHNTNKTGHMVRPDGSRQVIDSLLTRYELFLTRLTHRPHLAMLELGIGVGADVGASIRMWRDYFGPHAEIHVADIQAIAAAFSAEGFVTHVGDVGDPAFVKGIAATGFDFVIDDASHFWKHQVDSFRCLFPSVKSGGIYIVEDLCTSFAPFEPARFAAGAERDAAAYFLALSRACCAPHVAGTDAGIAAIHPLTAEDVALVRAMDMIAWMGNSAIIVKR